MSLIGKGLQFALRQKLSNGAEGSRRRRQREVTSSKRPGGKSERSSSKDGEAVQRWRKRRARREVRTENLVGRKERICKTSASGSWESRSTSSTLLFAIVSGVDGGGEGEEGFWVLKGEEWVIFSRKVQLKRGNYLLKFNGSL